MYFSSAAVAILLVTSTAIATPVTSPEAKPVIILGTELTEAETLAAGFVISEDSTAVFSEAAAAADDDGGAPLTKRSYMASCHMCMIMGSNNQHSLYCRCRAADQSWKTSLLDLTKCLANINGRLTWRVNGHYQLTCQGSWLYESKYFTSICKPMSIPASPINLDEKIHNWNGVLGCQI